MAESVKEIAINLIDPSPYQHRRYFDKAKLNELANSIKRDGLIEPIVVRPQNGRYELIAGERRWRAAQIAELDSLITRIVEVSDLQARRMCAAENLQRQDLSIAEETEAIVEIIDAELGEYPDYLELGDRPITRVYSLLGMGDSLESSQRQGKEPRASSDNIHNVFHKFMEHIVRVFTNLPKPKEWRSFLTNDLRPYLNTDEDVKQIAAKLKANKSQMKAYQKLKKNAPKAFDKLRKDVEKAEQESRDFEDVTIQTGIFGNDSVPVTEASARDIERAITASRLNDARNLIPESATTPPFPKGKYRCIVIDPPWPIQKIERQERPDQGVTLDYPTMTIEEIQSLPIPDLAFEDGCHLYLWVTQKFLPVGLELVAEWGFRYECLMTWNKNVGITPFSWMYDTEHIIFARKGHLPLQQKGLRLSFEAKVQGHSIKPDTFYDKRVILASPTPRLEMFARKQREHFEVWGNEVNEKRLEER